MRSILRAVNFWGFYTSFLTLASLSSLTLCLHSAALFRLARVKNCNVKIPNLSRAQYKRLPCLISVWSVSFSLLITLPAIGANDGENIQIPSQKTIQLNGFINKMNAHLVQISPPQEVRSERLYGENKEISSSHEMGSFTSKGFAESKRKALELVDSLVNDEYRVRDGFWMETLTPQKASFLQVTLFAGNHYWFVAAAAPPGRSIKITLFDVTGHLVKLEPWNDALSTTKGRVAGGFTALQSGRYFVGMELTDSKEKAKADCSLVYAYK